MQRYLAVILLAFLALFGVGCSSVARPPVSEHGVLDLRAWDFERDGNVRLPGRWAFYWGELLDGSRSLPPARDFLEPSSTWRGVRLQDGRVLDGTGFATYHLKLHLPSSHGPLKLYMRDAVSAYRFYMRDARGRLLADPVGGGRVSTSPAGAIASYLPAAAVFAPTETVDVYLQVSNFHHFNGSGSPVLHMGLATKVNQLLSAEQKTDFFLIGTFAVMGLYHLVLYLLRPQEKAPLWFGAFCLLGAARSYLMGRHLLVDFPDRDLWWLAHRAEYLTVYLAVPPFLLFFHAVFREYVQPRVIRVAQILSGGLALLVILTPSLVYSRSLIVFHLEILLLIPVTLWWILRAIRATNHREAWLLLVGLMAFALAGIHDVLRDMLGWPTGYVLQLGVFVFIFCQMLVLAVLNQQARTQSEGFLTELGQINKAYSRFVPQEFLNFLSKRSITEVQLGDQVQREMTILFSDIRDFTALSETMTPEQNFNFINSYLSRMGPIVTRHGGFIDKYIGDSIMALFPDRPEDALDAAIAMIEELRVYNGHRANCGYQPISVGIGIHAGKMMLGTIGDKDRMEGTVISDAVNLASRLEGLTKDYGAPILISEEAVSRMADPDDYELRFLDSVRVKGKRNSVDIYEVLHADPPELRQQKLATRGLFGQALQAYLVGDFEEADELFSRLAVMVPDDQPLQFYLRQCQRGVLR